MKNFVDVAGRVWVVDVNVATIKRVRSRAGVNLLEECKPPVTDVPLAITRTGNDLRLSWPATAQGFQVQGTSDLGNPQWGVVNATVEVVGDQNVASLPIGTGTQYFRLMGP